MILQIALIMHVMSKIENWISALNICRYALALWIYKQFKFANIGIFWLKYGSLYS